MSIQTEIKNLMASHLSRKMFGMEIYGQHEIKVTDGQNDFVCVLDVRGAGRFDRYGTFAVYHPLFGKWQASLLSEHHTGKPVQVLTADQIRDSLKTNQSQDFIYRVYGVEKLEYAPIVWDWAQEVR